MEEETEVSEVQGQDAQPSVNSAEEDSETDWHAKFPPLPGHREHSCTDIPCFLVVLLVFALQGYVYHYAWERGDFRRLTRGYDYKGRLCGLDVEEKFLFHCLEPNGDHFMMMAPTCVSKCPSENETVACYNSTLKAEVESPAYRSHSVLNYCVPWHNATLLVEFLGDTNDEETASEARSEGTKQLVRAARRLFVRAVSLLKRAWLPLLFGAILATIVGYAYLLLLNHVALQLVYTCEFCVVSGSWLAGFYLIRESMGAGSDGLEGTHDSFKDLGLGMACCFGGCIALCVAKSANRNIVTAAGCIEATCECMFQQPSLLIEPLISLGSKLAVVAVYSWLVPTLISIGHMTIPNTEHDGILRDFTLDPLQQDFVVSSVLVAFWFLEITHAASHYSLAWTTQMWYFTPYVDDGESRLKLDRLPLAVFKGYWNAFRYHLGTLALGALLCLTFRPARFLLMPLAKMSSSPRNPLSLLLSKLFSCCLSCYANFLSKLKKTAYMDVAITSSNFSEAARRADELLRNEVPGLAVLDGAQLIFQLALIGITSYVGFFSVLMMTTHLPVFYSNKSAHYIENSHLVSVIAGIICGSIGAGFMLVFDTVGDTIMYCFALEQRRHREIDHRKFANGEVPSSYLSCFMGYDSEDELDDPKAIAYAPDRLRSLIDDGR